MLSIIITEKGILSSLLLTRNKDMSGNGVIILEILTITDQLLTLHMVRPVPTLLPKKMFRLTMNKATNGNMDTTVETLIIMVHSPTSIMERLAHIPL